VLAGLLLEIDIGECLAGSILHDEARLIMLLESSRAAGSGAR